MSDLAGFEEMLGGPIPVLSNRHVARLLEGGQLTIDPFEAGRLGPTSYRLCPYRLRYHFEDEEGLRPEDKSYLLDAEQGHALRPGEYAVVSPRERISLSQGLIADFFPSSWCIENKLVLTSGRLDAGYTADLVFGVFNGGRTDVILTPDFQLARVTFGWLGRANIPIYGGQPPGAYIPQLNKLREREAALDTAEEELRKQRAEIAQLREELSGHEP